MIFLVIKHVTVEGLGIFEQFCHEAGIAVDTVEIETGNPFSELEGYSALLESYSALWVLGGPMNVAEESDYPWLVQEKDLIRKAVKDLQIPYMGICLGAQLLADVLGGQVTPMPNPEVGILPVTITRAGLHHPLTTGLSNSFPVLQWHGQEVTKLPEKATILASSAQCQVQAYAVGSNAFGIQFHSEATTQTVGDWNQIPAYRSDLEVTLGKTGNDDLQKAVAANITQMNRNAKILFDNFLQILETRR